MSDPKLSSTTLEGSSILNATVEADGEAPVSGSFDLNQFIGNVNGAFSWGGTNFSEGAQNVHLSGDGQMLEADLPDSNGELAHSVINLRHEFADIDGNPALKAVFEVPHSTAHALASHNDQADQAVAGAVDTLADDTTVMKIVTVEGDASTYWPKDVENAPAPFFWTFLKIEVWAGTRNYGKSSGGSCIIL
ncbi:CVNH domain-containing protein [Truncatella angustata]|uniref:CVNH domain-containing protein n=1 Tax=Truncatella angustata TaxID=152316 RepID=A0A9P8UCL9_9PEZI|nr:CVNH domain-containing protein [Truncatella angustata]KAH6646385.1 CVNH domain-containing protein [Truncatella angustata]KAH8200019.1 hypothetical protein TruAng_005795 [Truncatella angustata]